MRENVIFSTEIMATFKAMISHLKCTHDKQNLTSVIISYEIHETSRSLFHEIHMK